MSIINDTSLKPHEVKMLREYADGTVPGVAANTLVQKRDKLIAMFNDEPSDVVFADPKALVKFNPHSQKKLGGAVGPSINGVAFSAPDMDAVAAGTNRELKESPIPVPENDEQKQQSAGVMILEPDGRTWLFSPRNFYLGYHFAFAKGQTLDKGETERKDAQETAVAEALQEVGLNVKIIGVQGDYDRGRGRMGRVYIAKRTGGTPYAWKGSEMQPAGVGHDGKPEREETAAVWLVPPEKLVEISDLNIPRGSDGKLKPNPDAAIFEDTLAIIELARQKGQTAEEGIAALTKEAVSATGYADLKPYIRTLQKNVSRVEAVR